MIKVNKDLNDIPESLIPAIEDMFGGRRIPRTSKTTHQRRIELIENGEYIDDEVYNSRYKTEDVKEKLFALYHHKCAFCETKAEQLHVEHYRPKKGRHPYHWLAYSWDNLLLACPTCNENKGTKFEIEGQRVPPINDSSHLKYINSLSSVYNDIERPKLVNPETTEPEDSLEFTKEGKATSHNERIAYTITTCKLDRKYLNDNRRRIFDEFKRRVTSIYVEYSDNPNFEVLISQIIRDYIHESQDLENEYLAFRRYTIKKRWLNDYLKEILAQNE